MTDSKSLKFLCYIEYQITVNTDRNFNFMSDIRMAFVTGILTSTLHYRECDVRAAARDGLVHRSVCMMNVRDTTTTMLLHRRLASRTVGKMAPQRWRELMPCGFNGNIVQRIRRITSMLYIHTYIQCTWKMIVS